MSKGEAMSKAGARRTALYGEHARRGARFIPFGGFDMPVQYAGILAEHEAVRRRAGLFDLSHMGQFVLEGNDVEKWADRLTINAVSTMKPGQARYNVFTNERGGAHDDVIFYRLNGSWLLVVNAGNAQKMWQHLESQASGDVRLHNRHGSAALIAIQGPRSVEMLQDHCTADISALRYYFCVQTTVYGKPAIVARTGYTGEDGFELFLDGNDAPDVWRRLLDDNAAAGLIPAGLGARDVLRLEAGMPLYGHELNEEITPLQAGLGWAIKFGKPEFVGKDALETQKRDDKYSRIAGLMMEGRAPAREGYRVFSDDRCVGEIRSGSVAPSLQNKSVATALLEKDAAAPGTPLAVHIRGTAYGATVVELPFYKRR